MRRGMMKNNLTSEILSFKNFYDKERHLECMEQMDSDVFYNVIDYCEKSRKGYGNLINFWAIIDITQQYYDDVDAAGQEGKHIHPSDSHRLTDLVYEITKNCSNTNINSLWSNEGCGWTSEAKLIWDNRKRGLTKSQLGLAPDHFNTPQGSCSINFKLYEYDGKELSYSELMQVCLEWTKIRFTTKKQNAKLIIGKDEYGYQDGLYRLHHFDVVDNYGNRVNPDQTWYLYLPKHERTKIWIPHTATGNSIKEISDLYCKEDYE